MIRVVSLTAAVVLTAACAQAENAADAPALVAAWPDEGAVVASGEQTLRWTFDQAMDKGGWSVTGAPDAMPDFTSDPAFSDDGRTFTIRMRLEPGRTYDLGVNSVSHMNFRSAAGVPAAFRRIRFSTHPD